MFLGFGLLLSPGITSATTVADCMNITDPTAQIACLTQIVAQLAAQVQAQLAAGSTTGGTTTSGTSSTCVSDPHALLPPDTGTNDGQVNDPTQALALPGVQGSMNPTNATVAPGSSASFTILVSAINGYTGTVGLVVNGLPFGVGASFSPASAQVAVGAPVSTVLRICVGQNAPAGDFRFLVKAGIPTVAQGTLTVTRATTVGGSIASGIQSIMPTEAKKIKFFPDNSDPANKGISDNGDVYSASFLSLTGTAVGESPALVTDAMYKYYWHNSQGARCSDTDATCASIANIFSDLGDVAGPRYFSLQDPMNPVLDLSKIWNISTTDNNGDWGGDYGSTLSINQPRPVFSGSGIYSAARSNQGYVFVSDQGGKHAKTKLGGSAGINEIKGIMQSSVGTYLIQDAKIFNLTGFTYGKECNPNTGACTTGSLAILQPNPSSIPTLAPSPSKSVVVGDKIANFVSSPFDPITQTGNTNTAVSLKFYSLTQATPVAQITLPAGIVISNAVFGGFVSPEGGGCVSPGGCKYAYVISQPVGTVANKGEINPYKTQKPVSPMTLYMYKLNSAGDTLIPIAEGLKLDAGRVSVAVGISAAGNRALLTFNYLDGYSATPGNFTHAYLFADLANNLVRDVYKGAEPYYGVVDATSLARGDTTYVYTSYPELGNRAYVLKFDANSLNATAGGGTITPPSQTCPIAGQTNPHTVNVPTGCILTVKTVDNTGCGTNECTLPPSGGGGSGFYYGCVKDAAGIGRCAQISGTGASGGCTGIGTPATCTPPASVTCSPTGAALYGVNYLYLCTPTLFQ